MGQIIVRKTRKRVRRKKNGKSKGVRKKKKR